MKLQLESPALQFLVNLPEGTWSLGTRQHNLVLESCAVRALWKGPSSERPEIHASGPEQTLTPHGPAQCLTVVSTHEREGIIQRVKFALPGALPALLIQVELQNLGQAPLFLDRFELLRTPACDLPGSSPFTGMQPDGFYSNGWQSWAHSGAYGPRDRFQRTHLRFLTEPMRVNAGTPQPRAEGEFGSDMFGVLYDRQARRGWLAGFLAQQQGFGSLFARLGSARLGGVRLGGDQRSAPSTLSLWSNGDGARLDPQQRYTTDWATVQCIDLDDPDPLGVYLEAVAREHALKPERWQTIPTGWSSWYHYYGKLTAGDVRANLQAAAQLRQQLPLDLIQIDDGFEAAVGDWDFFQPSFPTGVAPLAHEIRLAGFTPGLWLAPFSVQRSSRLVREHPDWLLRTRKGSLVNAGFTFNEVSGAALDLTHPQAQEYVSRVIHQAVHEWGFPYLKLDFLYAAALPGLYTDPTRTRAQVLRHALELVRQAAGEETFLLGCGCPLGSAIGLVDAMRIGADVAERWQPAYFGVEAVFRREPDIPAVRNAIQNTLTRAPLHRRWWINDPDALLLSPRTRLSLAEVHSLATVIALSGGSMFISAALHELPAERLHMAACLLPPIGQRPQVPDLFDSPRPPRLRVDLENESGAWHCLALFNWTGQPAGLVLRAADFGLEPGEVYVGREFWSGQSVRLAGTGQVFPAVPPHGVVLVSVRAETPGRAAYLGSELHISQGLEVRTWQARPGLLEIGFTRPVPVRGEIELYLPNLPLRAFLDEKELAWRPAGEGRYRFSLHFLGEAHLRVETQEKLICP